nr:immunoglobulin light chain junction region [Macaca mulatta]MOW71452.1 immunoglobulin light chain junction region [Macaca mulatta]
DYYCATWYNTAYWVF